MSSKNIETSIVIKLIKFKFEDKVFYKAETTGNFFNNISEETSFEKFLEKLKKLVNNINSHATREDEIGITFSYIIKLCFDINCIGVIKCDGEITLIKRLKFKNREIGKIYNLFSGFLIPYW